MWLHVLYCHAGFGIVLALNCYYVNELFFKENVLLVNIVLGTVPIGR